MGWLEQTKANLSKGSGAKLRVLGCRDAVMIAGLPEIHKYFRRRKGWKSF